MQIIYPVVMPISKDLLMASVKNRNYRLSCQARMALWQSSRYLGIMDFSAQKDDKGIPLPHKGIFWSVSHKASMVAGVCARFPIGLDVEQILPRRTRLFAKIADKTEWGLLAGQDAISFSRCFTAKEAVLKACGSGLRDLCACRIVETHGSDRLVVFYRDVRFHVEQVLYNGHLISITNINAKVSWCLTKDRDKKGSFFEKSPFCLNSES